MRIVEGGWKMMYGMKKTKLAIFYPPIRQYSSQSLRTDKTHVSEASELKLSTHTGNVGSTHVGSIHKRDTVHGADSHNQTTINALDNAALLLFGEAMVGIYLGADLAGSMVEMLVFRVKLLFNSLIIVWSLHDCSLSRAEEFVSDDVEGREKEKSEKLCGTEKEDEEGARIMSESCYTASEKRMCSAVQNTPPFEEN